MDIDKVIGVGWYSEAQWTMLKLWADDHAALDSTYDEWLRGAESLFQKVKGEPGVLAIKVPVDVDELRRWCKEHGKKVDASARAFYVSDKVKRMPLDDAEA